MGPNPSIIKLYGTILGVAIIAYVYVLGDR